MFYLPLSLVLRTLGNNLTAEKIANLSPSPKSARKLLPSAAALDSPQTPSKAFSSQEKELAILRKELQQKSELVRSDFLFRGKCVPSTTPMNLAESS